MVPSRHPRKFFADLRAPAFCRVAGRRCCAHGLCQKQEQPKAGVVEVLEWLALDASYGCCCCGDDDAPCSGGVSACGASSASELSPLPLCVLSLECLAWLYGALGQRDAALAAWGRAASAGSARAQLDVGVRSYGEGTASPVYTTPSTQRFSDSGGGAAAVELPSCSVVPDPPPALPPAGAGGAEALLRAAASNPSLRGLGLEGHVIRARAQLYLGMMSLDGDGSA